MHAARYHALFGLKFKHGSIAFAYTTHATKIIFMVLSPNCIWFNSGVNPTDYTF